VNWARGFGPLERAGVEGTGSFGAGLTRLLRAQGIEVFEVIRPKRRDQYRSGKSDPCSRLSPPTTMVSISLGTAVISSHPSPGLEAIPRPARLGGAQWHGALPESPRISPSTGIKRHP
jgi:hypothetical protein